jgi:hypothetical protein
MGETILQTQEDRLDQNQEDQETPESNLDYNLPRPVSGEFIDVLGFVFRGAHKPSEDKR